MALELLDGFLLGLWLDLFKIGFSTCSLMLVLDLERLLIANGCIDLFFQLQNPGQQFIINLS